MTDNEIITALKSEIHLAEYIDNNYCENIDISLIQSAINSINRLQAKVIKEQNKNSKLRNERNRLQAEIERLKECPKCVYEYDGEITEYCVQGPCPNFKTVEQIKVEAYKEFAKLLRRQSFDRLYVSIDEINNLLKEIAGEDNAKEKE